MDEFYQVIAQLPSWLSVSLEQVPESYATNTQEIRLRINCVPMMTYNGAQIPIHQCLSLSSRIQTTSSGIPSKCPSSTWIAFRTDSKCDTGSDVHGNSLTVQTDILYQPMTHAQIEDIFFYLCKGSVHSFQDELSQGFFTLCGGHRVGVGGTYIQKPSANMPMRTDTDSSWQLQRASSLNIRIARHHTNVLPHEIFSFLSQKFTSVLIIGEPNSGKTTVTRNIITALCQQYRAVVAVDERGEFAVEGVDCIHGMKKCDAVQLALRTLSPEVIVLDELGTLAELIAIEQGFFAGVAFVATLHAGSFEEFERKPQFKYMHSHGMLQMVYLLRGKEQPGTVYRTKAYPVSDHCCHNLS